MIAAPSSNSGKTLICLGLIRALKKRGYNVSAFKVGPDFIDRQYIGLASGKAAGNLDLHLMGEEGLGDALYLNQGDIAVVEGVMGYFDGIYNTYKNSSYDLSKKIDIATILVYSPVGEMFTIIPKIKGLVDFSQARIKGLIFNKTSEAMYGLLKEMVEEHIDIEVLGFIPDNKEWAIENKYLGLSQEINNLELEKLIEEVASQVESNINIASILEMGRDIQVKSSLKQKKYNLKVAIARDSAFSFYYEENIKLLEMMCDLVYFSPLSDEELPKAELVLLGGGYPELFKKELSSNVKMRKSIKSFVEKGGYLYAEGGGLMYLSQEIESLPMVGIFEGKVEMSQRLQNFGYVNIEVKKDSLLGKKGDKLRGNEYHYSKFTSQEKTSHKISKALAQRSWDCAYQYKNALASYQHIHFLGNIDSLHYLLSKIADRKESGNVY